jgi:putative endonuclease
MIIIYAIHDSPSGDIYVGLTNDIERRMSEHKRGNNRSTKNFKNIKLLYTEQCKDYKSARIREKYLKSGCGKEFLKSFLKK